MDDDSWFFTTIRPCIDEIKSFRHNKVRFEEKENEAAFYGPKIDIQMKDMRGQENTAFTVQYDFCMPDRFDLLYTDNEGKQVRPIVVHRSSIGAIERIMAFLIEHYAGEFPLWLAPTQIKIIPIKSDIHGEHASTVYSALKSTGIRVELDDDKNGLGKNNKGRMGIYWL